ncbi:hypothetical protein MBLNU13_g08652t1 [Cladosporium sp. NU13]
MPETFLFQIFTRHPPGQCFGNLCITEIVERTREQGHLHRADKNRGFRTFAEEFESVKIFCRNPSPRPLVRPLTHLPVDAVGRLNFEPLELLANRLIFLTRYGDSMYFAPAHNVSVNRQPQPSVSRAEGDGAPATTPPAPSRPPFGVFVPVLRGIVESWAFCGT